MRKNRGENDVLLAAHLGSSRHKCQPAQGWRTAITNEIWVPIDQTIMINNLGILVSTESRVI